MSGQFRITKTNTNLLGVNDTVKSSIYDAIDDHIDNNILIFNDSINRWEFKTLETRPTKHSINNLGTRSNEPFITTYENRF